MGFGDFFKGLKSNVLSFGHGLTKNGALTQMIGGALSGAVKGGLGIGEGRGGFANALAMGSKGLFNAAIDAAEKKGIFGKPGSNLAKDTEKDLERHSMYDSRTGRSDERRRVGTNDLPLQNSTVSDQQAVLNKEIMNQNNIQNLLSRETVGRGLQNALNYLTGNRRGGRGNTGSGASANAGAGLNINNTQGGTGGGAGTGSGATKPPKRGRRGRGRGRGSGGKRRRRK